MAGNPNPSPATRFKAGDEWAGNGKGKTSAHRKAEVRAAESAAILRDKALSEMLEQVERGEMTAIQVISADNLRLFRDSEDRAHGTPKASTEITGADGGPIDTRLVIERRIVDAKADEG